MAFSTALDQIYGLFPYKNTGSYIVSKKVNCNCSFNLSNGSYATHYYTSELFQSFTEQWILPGLIKNYVKILGELEGKKKNLFFLKKSLMKWWIEKNLDEVETSVGTLKRYKDGKMTDFL